jgi:hypothetical protein
MTPIDTILSRLRGVKKTSNGWDAICPAHDDTRPSLGISEADDGKVLLVCRSNHCTFQSICKALQLEERDLFPNCNGRPKKPEIVATYDYTDEAGCLLYQSVRYEPKDFKQRRRGPGREWIWNLNGVPRVLYRLPEIVNAPEEMTVWIVEGEKDADLLHEHELVATTNSGGAGKWPNNCNEVFRGRPVVVLPDNDDAGRRHARQVAKALEGIAASVKVLELPGLPDRGDASDWFAAGGTASEMTALAVAASATKTGAATVPDDTTITAAVLMDTEIKEAPCIVAEMVPEGMTILAGKPKLGKSWLAMALGLDVALDNEALGRLKVQAGDVLYLALEDTRQRLRKRLLKLLPNGERPTRLHFQTTWPRQGQGGLEAIDKWLGRHADTRLVIIDTWPKFRPARSGKTQDGYEVDYRDAAEVKALADQFRIGILIITHCRKLPAEDPVDSVSGTLGLTGCADAVVVLKRERGQHDAALFVGGRDIEETELALRFECATCRWSLLGMADEYRISRERANIVDLLKKAQRRMSPSEMAPLLEKSPNATRVMLYRMHQDGWLDVEDGKYGLKENE